MYNATNHDVLIVGLPVVPKAPNVTKAPTGYLEKDTVYSYVHYGVSINNISSNFFIFYFT